MPQKIELIFYRTDPSPENIGMKQVLFKVTDSVGKVNYDFGYADWLGTEWDNVPVPEGYTIEVHSWANNPDPKHLIEEGKLISFKK